MSLSWTYLTCENCLKNAHKESKMVLRRVVSPGNEKHSEELYVCVKCGYTRKF